MLDGHEKFLINRSRPTFYEFIFTFPELTNNDFFYNDFSQAPHKNIDISAKVLRMKNSIAF
jgi:hypothetical protein